MAPDRPPEPTHRPTTHTRRRLLAAGASVAAMALAGCAGDGTADTTTDGPTAAASTTATATDAVGTFRLLVSDQPAAIEDFDSLDVTFDRARVFRAGGDDSSRDTATDTEAETDDDTATDSDTGTEEGAPETATDGTATQTSEGTAETEADENATETSDGTAGTEEDTPASATESDDDAAEDDEGGGGFTVIDLDGATVDLTEVIGEKAIGVFEDDLPAGRYTKIELYATAVDGVVDGEPVDVKIPPGKLMIPKPFTVEAGGSVSFVFDIGVVKRGKAGGYILKPIIGESGVAGEDVAVEEVDEDGTGAEDGARPDDGDDAQAGDGNGDGDAAEETEPTDESDGPSNGETPTATATPAAEDG